MPTYLEKYGDLSSNEQSLVIRLGMIAFENLKVFNNSIKDDEYRSKIDIISKDYENKISTIIIDYKEQIIFLNKKIEDYIQNIKKIQDDNNLIIRKIQDDNQRILDNLYLNHERERHSIISKYEKDIETLVETRSQSREKLFNNIMTKQKEDFDIIIDKFNEYFDKQSNMTSYKYEELNSMIQRFKGIASNSSDRGKFGEYDSEKYLDKYLPSGSLWENTSSLPGKGDFQVKLPEFKHKYDKCKIIIDIKNHEKDKGGVRSDDRKKLLRDIDSDDNIIAGILVATMANIQSMRHCQIIYSEKQKPMIACVLDGNWERFNDSIETLRCFFTASKFFDSLSESNIIDSAVSNEDLQFYDKINNIEIIKDLKDILESLCNQEKLILEQRNKIIENMTKILILLSKYDKSYDPSLRDFILTKLYISSPEDSIPKEDKFKITDLQKKYEAEHKDLSTKNAKIKLRDILCFNGIKFGSDDTILNARFRDLVSDS
jgi:hypothetical protein